MEFLLWIVHILVAATVVGLVLLQHGKGADMGAAFGSGSSGSLFGACYCGDGDPVFCDQPWLDLFFQSEG